MSRFRSLMPNPKPEPPKWDLPVWWIERNACVGYIAIQAPTMEEAWAKFHAGDHDGEFIEHGSDGLGWECGPFVWTQTDVYKIEPNGELIEWATTPRDGGTYRRDGADVLESALKACRQAVEAWKRNDLRDIEAAAHRCQDVLDQARSVKGLLAELEEEAA